MGLITDVSVLVYGLWTIACNVTVLVGGSATRELTWGVFAIGALLIALLVLAIRRPELRAAYFQDLDAAPLLAVGLPARGFRFGLLGLVALLLAVQPTYRGMHGAWLGWVGAMLFAALAALEAIRVSPERQPSDPAAPTAIGTEADAPYTFWLLHALGLLCGAFSLLSFRPRSDDAYYINMGVSVAMHPERALLAVQDMHGPVTQSLQFQPVFAPYRVHSFEALGGYLSYVTGHEVTYIVHMGLATFASWLAPFAIARLLRVLTPRAWCLALVATLLYYFIEGSAPRGYANQAFVRMFNGKGVMLTVALPLICAYGMRFAQRPTRLRFALLALAQISAMGLTSTAIWLAPMLATLAVVAALDRPWRRLSVLAWAVASSAWVLALGLWVKGQVSASKIKAAEAAALSSKNALTTLAQDGLGAISWGLPNVLGDASTARALLAMTAVALVFAPSVLARRWLAASAFVLAAFLTNPWLALKITHSLTGSGTYERVFWLLPIPIAVGLGFVGVLGFLQLRLWRPISAAIASTLLAGFLFVAADKLVVGGRNNASLVFPPVVKQSLSSRHVAKALCRFSGEDSMVLAPQAVSQVLVTLQGCGYPLMAGMRWMFAPKREEQRRNALQAWVGTKVDAPIKHIPNAASWVNEYGVDVIVFGPMARRNRRMISSMRIAGFEKVGSVAAHQLWIPLREETLHAYDSIAKSVCARGNPETRVLAPYGLLALLRERGCASSAIDATAIDATVVDAAVVDAAVVDGATLDDTKAAEQPLSDVARTELEAAVSVDQDVVGERKGWLDRALRKLKLDLVVMAPGAYRTNRRVQLSIKRAGLTTTTQIEGYRLYERPAPVEPAATGEPASPPVATPK